MISSSSLDILNSDDLVILKEHIEHVSRGRWIGAISRVVASCIQVGNKHYRSEVLSCETLCCVDPLVGNSGGINRAEVS